MPKLVKFDIEVRAKLLKGIDIVADAVGLTHGPKGKNVGIEKSSGAAPHVVHDGVTVAKSIDLSDPFENMGAMMIKQSALKSNADAGDGTTTATVLTQAIVKEGYKALSKGANPMILKKGIEKAVKTVTKELQEGSIKLVKNQIAQVATISAADPEIGALIAETVESVGKDGLITVEDSKGLTTTVDHKDGMDFNNGWLSPYFMTDTRRQEAVLEDAVIFLTDLKITSMNDLVPVVEQMLQVSKNKNIVVIADDVKDSALAMLVVNKMEGVFNAVAVKAPSYGDLRKEHLQDIATVIGATVLSGDMSSDLKTVTPEHFGKAGKIIVGKDRTIIVDGKGSKEAVDLRIDQIREQIEQKESEYEKERLGERLARLTSGIAVISVGAPTEMEMKERKERVIDAVAATRAAMQEGIVPGAGMALLRVRSAINNLKLSGDEQIGADILYSALRVPFEKILTNAGENPDEILRVINGDSKLRVFLTKLFDLDYGLKRDWNFSGYDVVSEKYGDLFKMGIIDPTMVTRLALQNSVSTATMILTTDCLVANESKEEK